MTATTPSIVMDDSATFVDRMTLRRRRRPHGRVLLFGREVAVQRHEREIGVGRELLARLPRPADLGRAGQKDEHVAVEALEDEPAHGRRHLRGQRTVVGRGQVLDCDVEALAFAAQDRRTQIAARGSVASVALIATMRRSGRRVAAEPLDQRQRHVALQVPLVELVEDDDGTPASRGTRAACAPSTPSVTNRMRVRALDTSSKRTW